MIYELVKNTKKDFFGGKGYYYNTKKYIQIQCVFVFTHFLIIMWI